LVDGDRRGRGLRIARASSTRSSPAAARSAHSCSAGVRRTLSAIPVCVPTSRLSARSHLYVRVL